MARVELRVGGRAYALACRDGDEPRLQALGQALDARAADLQRRLGQQTESELLFALAVTVADELEEARARLVRAAERVEAAAAALERHAAAS
jgi:cell division protein ZapA